MNTWKLLGVTLAAVLLISGLSLWFIPSVQDFMIENTAWNGMRNAARLLGADIVDDVDLSSDHTSDTVMILVPYLELEESEKNDIEQYVHRGGTLILMDDFGHGNHLLEHLGIPVRFDGRPLIDPLFCDRNPRMPKIIDFERDHIDASVSLVVLNNATAITVSDGVEVLSRSAETSFLDTNNNGIQDSDEPAGSYIVAAKTQYGEGRIVLVADPSILINSMWVRNDNRRFVTNLIQINSEDPKVFLNMGYLSKMPLDISKKVVQDTRDLVAQPYPALLTLGGVFAVVITILGKRG